MPDNVTLNHDMDILIVEDNDILNKVMTIQVKAAGYAVRSTKSGIAALKMIKERLPVLLILDVGLPDITGQEIIAALRCDPLTCSLPLIVHTTLELSDLEKRELELDASKSVFVTKTTAFSHRLGDLVAELINSSKKIAETLVTESPE
jgi:CheY-like chemotaxis protein